MRIAICLLIILCWLGPGFGRARGDDASSPYAALWERVRELRLEVWRKKAEVDARNKELAALESKDKKKAEPIAAASFDTFAALWQAIEDKLEPNLKARNQQLQEKAEALKKQEALVTEKWNEADRAEGRLLEETARQESRLGVSLDREPPTSAWDAVTYAILGGAVVALLTGVFLALHESRQSLRRRYRRALTRFASIIVVAGLAGLAAAAGCDPLAATGDSGPHGLSAATDKLSKEREEQSLELKKLANEAAATQKRVLDLRSQALERWSKWMSFPQGGAHAHLQQLVTEREKHALDQAHEILVSSRLIFSLAEDCKKIHKRVLDGQKTLDTRLAAHDEAVQTRTVTRLAIASAFLLAFVPLGLVRRKQRNRQRSDARKCPRCGELDTLIPKVTSAQGDKDTKYLECKECRYDFRKSYQRLPRLRFPTVGVRGSGKTHWLSTAYGLVKQGRVPVPATISKAMSVVAEVEFDDLIKQVLVACQNPAATVNQLPHPLNFHLEDSDGHAAMLNLFDYSGEMMDQNIDSELRQRALTMDGFFFFLDAAQVRGGGIDYDVIRQFDNLNNFKEDMREMRNLDVGAKINVPVAICLSRLDLLIKKNPIGDQARPWLEKLRATGALPLNLETLKTRSRLCEDELAAMFPGFNVPKAMKDGFGPNFMFFPMSPVNLNADEAELDDKDRPILYGRTPAPFGILEPVLWLLHMHGYNVFSD